jgi:DNA repair protein RadA/Sms
VRLRAQRLGLADAPVRLAPRPTCATSWPRSTAERPDPGGHRFDPDHVARQRRKRAGHSVAQVRAAAQELIRFAKRRGVAVVLVGHVTKEGQIAGPRVLEHMVDTVLYFEGERGHQFRILRAVKNRFGPADEIGVFEMTGAGWPRSPTPRRCSSPNATRRPGAVVFAGIEGTRPVLVEIQALVAPSPLGTPRRAVVGWDSAGSPWSSRCSRRAAASPSPGSTSISTSRAAAHQEPAADLAVAAALISAREDVALPADTVVSARSASRARCGRSPRRKTG